MPIALTSLNQLDAEGFVAVCGPVFEHSPWIATQAWKLRPFLSVTQLHEVMCKVVADSTLAQKLDLIRAHPDLVGRLARQGQLTRQSESEQAAAGLAELSPDEAAAFERYNAAYRERFGFPFVICARQNKKEAILAAFPPRLTHERDEEIKTALLEIFKIARLRLYDAVSESA